jgi:hypothetical protein
MHWSLTEVVAVVVLVVGLGAVASASTPFDRRQLRQGDREQEDGGRHRVGHDDVRAETHTYWLPMFTYSYEPTLKRSVAKQQVG